MANTDEKSNLPFQLYEIELWALSVTYFKFFPRESHEQNDSLGCGTSKYSRHTGFLQECLFPLNLKLIPWIRSDNTNKGKKYKWVDKKYSDVLFCSVELSQNKFSWNLISCDTLLFMAIWYVENFSQILNEFGVTLIPNINMNERCPKINKLLTERLALQRRLIKLEPIFWDFWFYA